MINPIDEERINGALRWADWVKDAYTPNPLTNGNPIWNIEEAVRTLAWALREERKTKEEILALLKR